MVYFSFCKFYIEFIEMMEREREREFLIIVFGTRYDDCLVYAVIEFFFFFVNILN
jgi:hypothetical protein